MTTIHWKPKSNREDDHVCDSSRVSNSNVHALRKLFENNFKLSHITNAFKKNAKNSATDVSSKEAVLVAKKHCEGSSRGGKQTTVQQHRCDFKENRSSHASVVEAAVHTSVANPSFTTPSSSFPPDKNYLNCTIENCCCKTFFREYNNTPTTRHQPKTPLRERSSELNCAAGQPRSATSSTSRTRSESECGGGSKVYEINYNFYKPNVREQSRSRLSFKEVLKDSSNKQMLDILDGTAEIRPRRKNRGRVFEFTAEKTTRKESYGFVNLTATSMSEGGYMKLENDEHDEKGTKEAAVSNSAASETNLKNLWDASKRRFTFNAGSNSYPKSVVDENDVCKIGNFSFKYRTPRSSKNIAVREQSHPYAMRKPRLTVKNVKNRNTKRKQQWDADEKSLSRSRTFGGYDNFAYRKSEMEPRKVDDDGTMQNNSVACTGIERELRQPVVDVVQRMQFSSKDNRVSGGYNWPVASFYIEKQSAPAPASVPAAAPKASSSSSSTSVKIGNNYRATDVKYRSARDLNSKHELNKSLNFTAHKSNLKRHCSLGYLEDEDFEYNFARNRRSLDNIANVSTKCGIRNASEVSSKIVKQRKFYNLDIHEHALFGAVEHGNVDQARIILKSSDPDVNSLNSDGLSPLDVAVLSNNKSLAKLLAAHGAREGRKFFSADDMRNHLYHLLHEAERRVQELSSSMRLNVESDLSSFSSSSSNIPSITISDSSQSKTYSIWERRAKGLKRMLNGFEQIRPPDLPSTVTIEVTSVTSIKVWFAESENKDSPVTTKFRVQWGTDKDFGSLCGHYEVTNTMESHYNIKNLCRGQTYYVRVASGNLKGYSAYKLSSPTCIVLSSWRDVTEKETRFSTDLKATLEEVFTNVVQTHSYLKSNVELYGQGGEIVVKQPRKKTTIKQLFTAASKFQKHLRRGVYLSCLLYHNDKVLVTNEDFLPVIDVDENYPKKVHNDFHWFFKVAFSWNDLKYLKTDLEKSQNSSAVFRIKLLQAAAHMQTALSIQELGKLYHKLIRDAEGTIVISVINYIHSPKSVSLLNLRWLPLAKLTKRTTNVNDAESNVADILMSTISDQIAYHQLSNIKLSRGLYLSYLKMRSSVDTLQILVPSRTPNILPHCKVRDNPHITAEEWEWLVKKENLRDSLESATPQQRLFVEQMVDTARMLFTYMKVPEEEANNHRIYDTEVIEVNKDVSLIMVVPPAETACSMPGQRELLLQRSDMLPLTVQVFEMVHFGTYQLDLISMYSRLSAIIEMDVDLAQHSLRKAFSSTEVSAAKSHLTELEGLFTQLNTSWKKARWLFDVISFARDRLSLAPNNMRHLLHIHTKRTTTAKESPCVMTDYLQPPDPKPAKSRGSWPGVGAARQFGRMPNEISRSEQHLTTESCPLMSKSVSSTTTAKIASNDASSLTDSEIVNPSITTSSTDMVAGLSSGYASSSSKYEDSKPLSRGNSSSGSLHSVSSDNLAVSRVAAVCDKDSESGVVIPVPSSVIIQIYAAYDTGLEGPLNFKFHVSPKTTAREIVELFVKQTNMTTLLRGKEGPVYSDKEIVNFCLVAVIGARERCLRDDFKPAQLQEPWKEGRLYVRQKKNVLAAIECESKQPSYV